MPRSTAGNNQYMSARQHYVLEAEFLATHGSDIVLQSQLRNINQCIQWLVDPRNMIPQTHDKGRIFKTVLRCNTKRALRLQDVGEDLWEDIKQLVRRNLATVIRYGQDQNKILTANQFETVVESIKDVQRANDGATAYRIRDLSFRPLTNGGIFENLVLEMAIIWLIGHVGPPRWARDPDMTLGELAGRHAMPAGFAEDQNGTVARLRLNGIYDGGVPQ